MTDTALDPDRARPRRFWLIQHQANSVVSGSSVVTEGAMWTTGQVTLHWPGRLVATSHWASFDDFLAANGNGTRTTVEWIDNRDDHSQCAEYDSGAIWVH